MLFIKRDNVCMLNSALRNEVEVLNTRWTLVGS